LVEQHLAEAQSANTSEDDPRMKFHMDTARAISDLLAENVRLAPSQQVETSSGHPSVRELRSLLHSAVFALLPFTLEDEIPGDIEDQAYVSVSVQDPGAGCFIAAGERIGTDIMNVRRIIAAIQAVLDRPPSQQAQALSGHLDFEAKAKEIVDGWWNDDCGSTLNELIPIIASALREASELSAIEALKHAAHDRECREAAEAALIEGHVNEIERLREALEPFVEWTNLIEASRAKRTTERPLLRSDHILEAPCPTDAHPDAFYCLMWGVFLDARAALGGEQK
jgi:hypothetical protein